MYVYMFFHYDRLISYYPRVTSTLLTHGFSFYSVFPYTMVDFMFWTVFSSSKGENGLNF